MTEYHGVAASEDQSEVFMAFYTPRFEGSEVSPAIQISKINIALIGAL